MKEIKSIQSISEIHRMLGIGKPLHPLITILRMTDQLNTSEMENFKFTMGLYQISLKDHCSYTIAQYGRNRYDFEEGTLVFISPNQVIEYEKRAINKEDAGWHLLFHPDLIRRSHLGQKIAEYSFFDYSANEALHVSEKERNTLTNLVSLIELEYQKPIDRHSQTLLTSHLELILNYSQRFYDRQFYSRSNLNKDIISQFEKVLKSYYQSDRPLNQGLPTVQFCAEALHISPKYLSDLLRKETGKNTQEHIHDYIIEKAKTILLNSTDHVSEIAYQLGYEYPQYFSRLFKKKTQLSPSDFRKVN